MRQSEIVGKFEIFFKSVKNLDRLKRIIKISLLPTF